MFNRVSKWLGNTFGNSAKQAAPAVLTAPEKIVYPGDKASLQDHVRFLLEAKRYIADHDVPEDRRDSLNQYSHAGKPLIGDDPSKPATTNCSYEFYGRKLVSLGFPLFVEHAPLIKDNQLNPAFNGPTYWDSFERLLKHHLGDLGDGDTKFGFYAPINHAYIEKPVPEPVFERAQPIIEFFTRTDIEDPRLFLSELSRRLDTPAAAPQTLHI